MPDKQFWEHRYQMGQMGWEIGAPATPLKEYLDQIGDKDTRILIPGAGLGNEAVYALELGFTRITVLDIATAAVEKMKERTRAFPTAHLSVLEEDFFEHRGQYDLIMEQSFFCAIEPELRIPYARQCHELLGKGGKLSGLLYNHIFSFGPPPYGGLVADYEPIFSPWFRFHTWMPSKNSIPPRAGMEWFMILEKKERSPGA